jgi:hypothetical protein
MSVFALHHDQSIMALQQPDMEVLNGSALSFTNELAKFSNIPAIVQGNAILNAITDLGDRLDGRLDNCFEQLTTRIRAAYVATELFFIAIQADCDHVQRPKPDCTSCKFCMHTAN